jgi:hypothetical protein
MNTDFSKMKKLGPGIYRLGATIHINAVEICKHLGLEPTEANQDAVGKGAAEALQARNPKATSHEIKHKDHEKN